MASVSYSNKKFVVVSAFTYIHTYIRRIYNARHGRACSSNRRREWL